MTVTIQDTKNGDTEVTTWNGAVLVVSFKVKSNKSYTKKDVNKRADGTYAYFGFDWIEVDNNGEITKYRNIGMGNCTHTYQGGANYTAANSADINNSLKSEFKIFESVNGSAKKYSTQAWLHLPDVNDPIENLSMKLDGTYQGQALTFEIPTGVTIEYKDGTTFRMIENKTPVTFINNEYQIRVTAKQEIEKAEINVKNGGGAIIGSLGVIAHPQRSVNVYLWSVVENPNGSKTKIQTDSAGVSLMYSTDEQLKLKEKLDQVYHQAGIDIILHVAGTITYDPNSVEYSSFVKNKLADSRQKGNDLYKRLKDDNKTAFDNNPGINLMILDAKSEYPTVTTEGRPAIGNLGGLGDITGVYSIVFNQARTTYGVCAHEIGHTLGLIHTFYDADGSSDDNVYNKSSSRQRLENSMKGKLPKDIDEYETIRLAEDKSLEILLFKEKMTENLMDYKEGAYDYLFKWQWSIIYTRLKVMNWKITNKYPL